MRNRILLLALILFPLTAWAQLTGDDTVPGSPCTAKGAVRMTANAAGPGAYILTCDGDAPAGKWVATINTASPTANEQVANKEYVDDMLGDSGIVACTDNYAGLCALETNRAGNDPQFVPDNIASGINILGVTGTLSGGGSPSGPADCPAIGDKCTDTTIFVGFHPVTGENFFIPPTDTGTTMVWKTSTGTDDIANDSHIDGKLNASQITISATFPAFKACDDLTLAGKNWYLPSTGELAQLYGVRPALVAKSPGNGFTDFQSDYYWSSTEYNTTLSWFLHFSDGTNLSVVNKTTAYRVRCVAR